MFAELAYVFRHAVLRDAAYQLMPPADRAGLHLLAADWTESLLGETAAPELADHLYTYRTFAGANADPREARYTELAALRAERNFAHAEALALRLRHAGLADGPGRAESTRKAAVSAHTLGRPGQALELLHRAQALATAQGDTQCQARVGDNLGVVLSRLGQHENAQAMFRAALQAFRASNNREDESRVLCLLGSSLMRAGKVQSALEHMDQALAIARQTGNRRAEAIATGNRARPLQELGRLQDAIEARRRAIELDREIGLEPALAIDLGGLAGLLRTAGENQQARELFEAALALHRKVGDIHGEAVTLTNYALLLSSQGQSPRALAMFKQAAAVHAEEGNRADHAIALGNIAAELLAMGQYEEAAAAQNRAADAARAAGDALGVSLMRIERAELARRMARHAEALPELEAAAAELDKPGTRDFCGVAHCTRALALLELGQVEPARGAWATGAAMLAECGDKAKLASRTAAMHKACARAGVPPLDLPGAAP